MNPNFANALKPWPPTQPPRPKPPPARCKCWARKRRAPAPLHRRRGPVLMLRFLSLIFFLLISTIAFAWALAIEVRSALRSAWLGSFAQAWHRWQEAWKR